MAPRKSKTTPKVYNAVCQKWEESEAGWGIRPDGYSLHLTEEDRKKYVEEFWKHQRTVLGEAVPHEYTRESGMPYIVVVDKATYKELVAAKAAKKFGISKDGTHPKGQPGQDGWRTTAP